MSKFSSLFKFKKSKNTRRYAYYNRENQVTNLADLLMIFNSKSNQEYNTTELIKHSGLALSEINETSLLKELKNPDYIMDDLDDINDYKVLFYRRRVDKFIFLLQFHFFKGSFVFVSNKISSHRMLAKSERVDLIKNMSEKYFPGGFELDLTKRFDIKINDNVNNFLKVIDEVDFRIHYVYNSSKNQKLINKHFDEIEVPVDDLQDRLGKFL